MTTIVEPDVDTHMETTRTGAPPTHETRQPAARPPKARGLIWLVLLVTIVGVAGYAVWRAGKPVSSQAANFARGGGGGGRGGGRGGAGLGPVPVVVANASRSSVPVILNGLGNVSAFYTVTIKSRVDGQLVKVNFREGDFVKEGQVLAEIDPRPFHVQLELAEATQAHDEALLKNARVDLERYGQLLATDAIPKQQLDTQTALVAQDEATVKQDSANIDNAKLQLTYSKVTAPISGVVGLRLVDPGNIVHASDATGMVVITQLQPISVLFTIPEDSLPQVTQKLRAGAHLAVEAYNRDNSKKLATGTLITVDNQIDNTTGTSKLKAVFDNKDNALFPQQFVNVHLLVDTLADQLVVPNVAVQNGQQGTFVYVVDDESKVHLRPVQIGMTTSTSSDILKGLSEGERVVVDGTDRLVEGATVRVRKAGELDNPEPANGEGGDSGRGRRRQGRGDGTSRQGAGGRQ
ncbi:MAG TPA: MdtA/MuxA family multidrug efflux RND transporter periplasmic adaptor subunit [Vicinamibacterales bacterium]|jgi:multidrug efflux system membrane fusion protein